MPKFSISRAAALAVAATLAGCGKDAPPPAPPVEVKVMPVIQRDARLSKEYVGEVRGSQEVDLRARVSGVLVKKHFLDGALVHAGDVLFSVDPREYRAQLANAKAQLASAQANLSRASQDVERYKPLVAENAISKQVYDQAVATAHQAAAQVDANKAVITEASLGVEYATVRAPLTGRIGAAQVFEGSLITAGTTALATLSMDDPAWVTFSISESDLLDFNKRFGTAPPAPDDPVRRVQLHLADGSLYKETGIINFADRAIDPKTGTYALRATFPNKEHALRPGLFARILVTHETRYGALLVPDRAIIEQLGRYFVTVVGEGNKAEARPIKQGPRLGSLVVIDSGVKAGDVVVVEGVLKARPGTVVKPIPVTEADLAKGAGPPAAPPAAADAKPEAKK